MVQVYVDYVIDRISSKSKAWTGFTIVWLLILFIASCIQVRHCQPVSLVPLLANSLPMAQANVSTAETEGNTEIMPDFECGKWLSSEASQEWGLASAGTELGERPAGPTGVWYRRIQQPLWYRVQ